jgi:hypothetical protein
MAEQLSGILLNYFAEAVLITILGSAILLVWYRRAVTSEMRAAPGAAAPPFVPDVPPATAARGQALAPERVVRRVRARLIVVYTIAGMLAAAVLAKLFLVGLGEPPRGIQMFAVWYVYCWPLVPTYAALLALSRRTSVWVAVGYVALGATLVLVWSLVSLAIMPERESTPLQNVLRFLGFLGLEAALPFLIIVALSGRRLRSVSAFLLAGLLVFSFGTLAVTHGFALSIDVPALRALAERVGAGTFIASWFMVAALPIGFLCWNLLRWLSRAYELKSFSDVQLIVDSWWLIATFFFAISLAGSFGWGGLAALVAFAGYRAAVALGLWLWPQDRRARGARLLLLRVFGFQRRTERLFDATAQLWRLFGSVHLIAAADLATRVIDPGDVITFMGGRLRDQFVTGEADIGRHLTRIDEAPDPDGRFRANEFFCHDATWRPMLTALLARSDAVLFDLRGFSPENSGCRFELGELARTRLLSRTVIVVDDTTDTRLLAATLAETAPDFAAGGAGANSGPGALIERVRPQFPADLARVRRRLATVASAQGLGT